MEPINLTTEQINGILSAIPNPPGIGKKAIRIARKHQLDRIKTILEIIKLVPVDEAYQEYKEECIQSVYESYVEPGMSVGVTAGVSLGGPVTQLSLNTFHYAGTQSGVAIAFQSIRDFLTGSKMNRSPQMKIYFKVPYVGGDLQEILHVGTFESIIAMRPELEQTMVSDVILDNRILTRDESEALGVPALVNLHAMLRPERFTDVRTKFPLSYVIELRLNTYRMYTHKITMKMVATAIEGADPPDALTCVWRSQLDERMYILVDESRGYNIKDLRAMTHDMSILMFLNRYITKGFSQWKISGITNVVSIEPQEVDVQNGIYRVRVSRENPGVQLVYTNHRKTRWDGVSLADIRRLLLAAGFSVRPITEKNKTLLYLTVDGFSGNLQEELKRRVTAARERLPADRTEDENAIVSAASFYYAATNGNNMSEIVWRDDVDLFRTVGNHSHEIYETLGIDAARIFLIFRFMQTLEEFSSYINPRHISLIFDLLCNLGIINSLSFVGINRRRIGPLAAASYERSLDVFVNSSIFGDRESIIGVSPSIYVGQKSKRIGTGSIAIEEDLTVVPQDRPTLPSMDEDVIWDDIAESEGVIEGTSLADMIQNEQIRQSKNFVPVPLNPQPSTFITNQAQPHTESVIPAGGQVILASQTLLSALQKVTTGTGLTVEAIPGPQVSDPNIAALSDVGDNAADGPPERLRPATETPSVMSSLRTIPIHNITSPIPQSETIQSIPIANVPSIGIRISTIEPPRNPPPPAIRVLPSPPRSSQVILPPPLTVPEPPVAEPSISLPSSFVNVLPDITGAVLPMNIAPQQRVSLIDMNAFSSMLGR